MPKQATVKIVFNEAGEGISLSMTAIQRYAAIKGFTIYPTGADHETGFWTIPPEARLPTPTETAPLAQRLAYFDHAQRRIFEPRTIARSDPALAQTVEELGDTANGPHARLKIAEVSLGERYRIECAEDRTGEAVMTVDDYDWEIA
jgi:hypothetical protein